MEFPSSSSLGFHFWPPFYSPLFHEPLAGMAGNASTDVWRVTAHYPFIFQSQSFSTRVKVQCLPWRDTSSLSSTPNEVRPPLQVFVCPDSLQIKVPPSPSSFPSLPSLSRHSTFCPTLSRAAPPRPRARRPTIRARSFLLSYFPAPRQSTIQGKETGQTFSAKQ